MSKSESVSPELFRFPIRLRNLTDLRHYCSLVDSCPFNGYIQNAGRKIQKDDVIALLDCCPNTHLMLCVYDDSRHTCRILPGLLRSSGLSV